MLTKFSDFFEINNAELDPGAKEFQLRVFNTIKDAETIVDCYILMFNYIIDGLKWRSMKMRKNKYIGSNLDFELQPEQKNKISDVENYFEGYEILEMENQVLFENLEMKQLDKKKYGDNVYGLEIGKIQEVYEAVQLYLQIQIYNEQYELLSKNYEEIIKSHPLPNQEINIDNFTKLKAATKTLITWMNSNIEELKQVIEGAADKDTLFKLVFSDMTDFSCEQVVQAIEIMINKIIDTKDTNPSTKKEFCRWVINEINNNNTFWNNPNIFPDYENEETLNKKNNISPVLRKEVFNYFKNLFADFLSSNIYKGETHDQAKIRHTNALNYIGNIFNKFSSSIQKIEKLYSEIMKRALVNIRKVYSNSYTGEITRASDVIKKLPSNLPENLIVDIKRKVDNFFNILPLKLKNADVNVKFYQIMNYSNLSALNYKGVFLLKNKIMVVVAPDPLENGKYAYRPVFNIFKYDDINRAIAFYNLDDLKPGAFYYINDSDPSVVKTDTQIPLTIDFLSYKINNSDRNASGQLYIIAGSRKNFFNEVQSKTKWKKIKGNRRYDPYYQTNPSDAGKPIPHLMGNMAVGKGLSRALPLGDDQLCLWMWNYSGKDRDAYGNLGELLGLPKSREIKPGIGCSLESIKSSTKTEVVVIGYTLYDYENHLFGFNTMGFRYQIISIKPLGDGDSKLQYYVQVNTPVSGIKEVLDKKYKKIFRRPLQDSPKDILNLFNFSYFRRITDFKAVNSDACIFTDQSKVIQLFKKTDTRKPDGPEAVLLKEWYSKDYNAVGVDLPICFNLSANIIKYFEDKHSRGKIINKGQVLYREKKPRKNAATAMNPLRDALVTNIQNEIPTDRVPATKLANQAMAISNAVRNDWMTLKLDPKNYIPVNQEWCHLQGHGDGGNEYPGNFVSGSIHCNTEQLAVECGQRIVTQQGKEGDFMLHTTAYLFRDCQDSKPQILTKNYLENTDYWEMLKSNMVRRTKELEDIKNPNPADELNISGESQEQSNALSTTKKIKNENNKDGEDDLCLNNITPGNVAPIAAYIRYKIMKNENSKRLKYFDFVFEGQSEFIDIHHFTIITRTVQFVLAGMDEVKRWIEQEKALINEQATAIIEETGSA